MELKIEQKVTKVGVIEVETYVTLPSGVVVHTHYDRSNMVFPAYNSLIDVLKGYKNVTIHVTTDSKALADEYNAEKQNTHATHLSNLLRLVARQNLALTVEYASK